MNTDSDRWDERYSNASPPDTLTVHPLLVEAIGHATPTGRAADVACGWGDAGLHLARSGFDVTCFDVSTVALDAVERRAIELDVAVATASHDTTTDGAPAGPWDILWCAHYLDREFLGGLGSQLRDGGIAAIAIATKTNRERHERPSARFLLDPNELLALVTDGQPALEVLRFDEEWRANDVHEAWLIVRKIPGA